MMTIGEVEANLLQAQHASSDPQAPLLAASLLIGDGRVGSLMARYAVRHAISVMPLNAITYETMDLAAQIMAHVGMARAAKEVLHGR